MIQLASLRLSDDALTALGFKAGGRSKFKQLGYDFCGGDISRLNLSGLNLSQLDLSGCNLTGCNLSGANLSGARLQGARLRGARMDKGTRLAGAAGEPADTGAEGVVKGARVLATEEQDSWGSGAPRTGGSTGEAMPTPSHRCPRGK